ncbi:nucleolar zinc-finger protein [Lecanora helva]
MGDENEYTRAQKDEKDLFAALGKKVLGLNSDERTGENEDDRVKVVDEIESYCMNCEQNGNTRLLLTKIPFFREVILSSFYCEHCQFANNEIQAAGQIQEQGSKFTLRIDRFEDLQRQLVKSDTATFRIEELDFEVPASRGRLTNVEGIITTLIQNLEDGQTEQRKMEQPEYYHQINTLAVQPLSNILRDPSSFPCTITLNDPTGNSSIEPSASDSSSQGKYVHHQYARTPEQNTALGLAEEGTKEDVGGMDDVEILDGKLYDLPTSCPGCTKIAQLLIQKVNIPHFKEVVLMNTNCGACGYQTKDVKTGGEVSAKGKRIWLEVKSPKDLHRDILKSESCLLRIPDFELSVEPGTMGGRFTTLEGLLTQLRNDLKGAVYDIDDDQPSDSMAEADKQKWSAFFAQLDKAIAVSIPYTVVMEDPLANSYCQNFDVPGPGNDPQIRSEEYDRTEEEEDRLGLLDMKTKLNENGEYVRDTADNKTEESGQISNTTNGSSHNTA